MRRRLVCECRVMMVQPEAEGPLYGGCGCGACSRTRGDASSRFRRGKVHTCRRTCCRGCWSRGSRALPDRLVQLQLRCCHRGRRLVCFTVAALSRARRRAGASVRSTPTRGRRGGARAGGCGCGCGCVCGCGCSCGRKVACRQDAISGGRRRDRSQRLVGASERRLEETHTVASTAAGASTQSRTTTHTARNLVSDDLRSHHAFDPCSRA